MLTNKGTLPLNRYEERENSYALYIVFVNICIQNSLYCYLI